MRALARRDEDVANVGGVDEFYEGRSDVKLPVEGSDVLPVPTISGARCLMIFTPFSVKGMSVEPVCDKEAYQRHIKGPDVVPYVSSFNLVLGERDRDDLRHATYRSTTTPFHLQEHVRRNACSSVYLFTVSDDEKAGHWAGLFGHDRGRGGWESSRSMPRNV